MTLIYMDNSATTRPDRLVTEKVSRIMDCTYGNASSLHDIGAEAFNAIGLARNQVASVISAKTSDIVFTSSGTESNNLAILGAAAHNKTIGKHIVTTTIEHASVINTMNQLEREGFNVTRIEPRQQTHRIEAKDVIDAVNDQTTLVSVMHVNNETGEILPIKEIVQGIRAKNPDTLIHCDCVQSYGKYPFKLYEMKVDLVSASAHKLHGPKGVGMLYVRDKSRLLPLMYGGKQESLLRPSTENTPGICGFGIAAHQALLHMKERLEHFESMKQTLLKHIENKSSFHINSHVNSVSYILNFSVLGKESQAIVEHFNRHNIYISAGSACKKGEKSYVLQSLGYEKEVINGAVRVSFSKFNTIEDVQRFLKVLDEFIMV